MWYWVISQWSIVKSKDEQITSSPSPLPLLMQRIICFGACSGGDAQLRKQNPNAYVTQEEEKRRRGEEFSFFSFFFLVPHTFDTIPSNSEIESLDSSSFYIRTHPSPSSLCFPSSSTRFSSFDLFALSSWSCAWATSASSQPISFRNGVAIIAFTPTIGWETILTKEKGKHLLGFFFLLWFLPKFKWSFVHHFRIFTQKKYK